MLSFIYEPSDIFLVKTSYIYKPEDNMFVLILHVPLVSPHYLMPMYEFIPLLFGPYRTSPATSLLLENNLWRIWSSGRASLG
jgi:hypothetical protein